jgi:hypothetical protein
MLRASDRLPKLEKSASPGVSSNRLAADPRCQAGRSSLGATIASQDPFSSKDSSNRGSVKSL